ncbi:MAG TPA: maleylpyruvate isomerase family mycothiol-dependent enzyme [Chloroflexota bacterium]|nr:maleylpyruvate isomerase family mycothiol-dependent enzyme [Chloroflexota bacterium]
MNERAWDEDGYMEAIRRNSSRLAEAARRDLKAPVPTCPGWFVAGLVAHIGEVQRFWALQIRSRARAVQNLSREEFDCCPGLYDWFGTIDRGETDLEAIPAGLVEWFQDATTELLKAFAGIGPEEHVWHWSGDNRPLTHMRNQAVEATIHRWDAENAVHEITPIDQAFAVDAIDQHFEVQVPFARGLGAAAAGQGERFLFEQTDGPRVWLVRFDEDNMTVYEEPDDADVVVKGRAEDLLLFLWNRIGPDQLEVAGDPPLALRYRGFWQYPESYS